MEYVFGTKGDIEVLKTKGSSHTELTGFRQIEQVYPDQTITDNFRVVRKLDNQEDAEGNCYDWYEIDRHYRVTDKSAPIVAQMAEYATEVENALCEQDSATDERMSAFEDVLCEQDSATDERLSALEDAVCELDAAICTINTINE